MRGKKTGRKRIGKILTARISGRTVTTLEGHQEKNKEKVRQKFGLSQHHHKKGEKEK